MKKYLIKLLFFLLPVFLLFLGIEFYIRNAPNAFITKSNYLKENKENIQTLFLGPSYIQNGINPKYFKENTCNLGYGSQDIKIDSALFFQNVKEMKSLKNVVFDLSYPRMDIENEKNYFRNPWYYIFYGVEIEELTFLNKLSLYSSSPSFFNNVIENDLKGITKPQLVNKFGFVEKNYTNNFAESNYDSIQIVVSAKERLKERHQEISNENFRKNKTRLEPIIQYCKANKINFYLVSTPYYFTFRQSINPNKKKRVDEFISYLINKYNINYIDLSANKKFVLKDFSNDDHLNANGAEKYSKIMDSVLTK